MSDSGRVSPEKTQPLPSRMRLYLMRHAEAFPGLPDEAREITPGGYATLRRQCAALRSRGLPTGIGAVWHSPYVRARQTAEAMHETLAMEVPLVAHVGLVPDGDPEALGVELEMLSQDGGLLVVTHLPFVGELAERLLGPSFTGVPFSPGTLLVLDRVAGAASGTFRWRALDLFP